MTEPRGWHSRGYLPHFDGGEVPQAVTFRLAGTLPGRVLDRWREQLRCLRPEEQTVALDRLIQAHLDRSQGAAWLADPAIAEVVEQRLLWSDGDCYRLHAWVVMPNHVHVLVTPTASQGLSDIVQAWKSVSARRINTLLGRTGPLWQPDYFDRYIRDERHYNAEVAYIHANPVKAGLCAEPIEWPWGSACRSAGALARTGPPGPRSAA